MSFHELGLSAELLLAVADQGYRIATPVQRDAIPPILQGRDVVARAQTGTGKTAAFALPLLHRLSARPPERPAVRALILTPTRELAAQVAESVRDYGRYLPLATAVVFGGVSIEPQVQNLRRGVDVLVATPGRLLDLLGRSSVDLSRIEILVLDEADRMLDMGFLPDIQRILARLPKGRQNLLFSATFPDELRSLVDRFSTAPVRIEVARRNAAAERVSHIVHPVARGRKRALLTFLIRSREWNQVLVFTRTKRGAERLSRDLVRERIATAAIHGDRSQRERTRALSDFKRGAVQVLVATDVAARGLDIEKLPYVVNFDLPAAPEDYVHRIGRTGRADREGQAVSLVCQEESEQLRGIERLLGRCIANEVISGYELPSGAVPADRKPLHSRAARRGRRRAGRPRAQGRARAARTGLERSGSRSEPR